MKIRSKLFGFSLLATLFLIALLGVAGFFYLRIRGACQTKELLYGVVQSIQDARVTEKAYAQFFEPALRDAMGTRCAEIRSELDALKEDDPRFETTAKQFVAYADLFRQAAETHDRRIAASQAMRQPLASAQSSIETIIDHIGGIQSERQMEGEELTVDEREILSIARQCNILLLKLRSVNQDFLLTGDAKHIERFNALLGDEATLLLDSLEAFASVIEIEEIQTAASKVKRGVAEFQAQGGKVQSLFDAESAAFVQLDTQGGDILRSAEDVLGAVERESVEAEENARVILAGVLGVAILSFLLISIKLIHNITRPLNEAVGLADAVAEGDLSHRLQVRSRDETGQLAEALNRMAEGLHEKSLAAQAVAEGDLTARVHLASSKDELGKALETMLVSLREIAGGIQHNSDDLGKAAMHLAGVSEQLASGTEQMSGQAATVSSATNQLSSNIGSVASAAEELSANMGAVAGAVESMAAGTLRIGETARQGNEVGSQALEMARGATTTMDSLGEAAHEITGVTDMIKRIAEQTNLLALNATIEAASAGDAGKGFAVVANEIKELASQSAQAAEDIAGRIEGMQENTRQSIETIARVVEIIETLHAATSEISSAVEEQTQTSDAIAQNVRDANQGAGSIASTIGEAAQGAGDVAASIHEVHGHVTETSQSIDHIHAATQQLSAMAEELRRLAGRFRLTTEGGATPPDPDASEDNFETAAAA